jgi:hypothetical protein
LTLSTDNRIRGVYSCENNQTLQRDLKERLGFKGWVMSDWVRKRVFLRHLYIKVIILPRQAREKHRENSKTDRFRRAVSKSSTSIYSHLYTPMIISSNNVLLI